MLNLFGLLTIFLLFLFYLRVTFNFVISKIYKKSNEFNNISFSLIVSSFEFLLILFVQEYFQLMYLGAFFINFLFLFTINLILSKFNFKIFGSIFNILLTIYVISQRYVTLFKGAPFTIEDLGAFKTALSVVKNYDFTPSREIILGFIICFLTEVIIFYIKYKDINFKVYLIFVILSIFFLFFILTSFSVNKNNIEKMGSVNFFDPVVFSCNYGSVLSLYLNYIYSDFDYPKDFDKELVIKAIDNIDNSYEKKEQAVNIICILEESFFDLSLVTNINPSKDYLSYYHSLEENTIKGNTIVSSFGGGTANSEYEFLMNGNMAFLPNSSYPFTKYINSETFSFVSALKDLDFRTIAFHPYYEYSWNRNKVYPLMGFDEFHNIERVLDNVDWYEENSLRGFLSDSSSFKEIIEIYENKKEGENLFIYNVTIQNHAGYGGYPEINQITDSTYHNSDLNTYLSLINESDKAIEELIRYFDNVDEPTLICIFGDHIPGELLDLKEDFNKNNLEESLKYYTTPFLIHTNYDIEETDYYDGISLSYLSTLVMDYANLPKTKEQAFVQSFMDKYPIINKYVFENNGKLELISNDISNDLKLWRDYCYMNLSPKSKLFYKKER